MMVVSVRPSADTCPDGQLLPVDDTLTTFHPGGSLIWASRSSSPMNPMEGIQYCLSYGGNILVPSNQNERIVYRALMRKT